MNFFHMQLHPDKPIGVDAIKNILEKKGVVGVGSGNDAAGAFKSQPKLGDIIVVREGATPIALVRVVSEWYEEPIPDYDLDWFDLRRDVDVLEFYKGTEKFPYPRKTFMICDNMEM